MARPRSRPDLHLLSKVATLYYLRSYSQQEIADRLHLSRQKVSRLLQEALREGVVEITYRITGPASLHLELETRLETAYGLAEVHVVDVDPGESVDRRVGAVAADYLARTLQPGETIGLAWGKTLGAMVEAMHPTTTEDVRIVQALGGVGPPESDAYAGRLVRRLAELIGATAVMLPAPGVVRTSGARNVLRDDPHIRAALDRLGSLDALFVGIGSLRSNPVLSDGHSLPPGTYEELAAAGAVGDVALRFFDASGALVRTSLDGRILGITPGQLAKVPRVIAAAGGPQKVDAIQAALRGKLVHVLITDQATAAALAERS